MSIVDLFGLDICKIAEFLQRWHIHLTPDYIQAIIDLLVWGVIIFCVLKWIRCLLSWIWNLLPMSNKKQCSEYIHNNLDHDFKDYLGKKNKKQYIETHFLSCPPHDYDEPNQATTASTRESMTSFCERIFKEDNPNERLYMVLAGSGMGKTTFMVNMFCHYVRTKLTHKGLPLNIRLLRLDDENVINTIQDITKDPAINPNKTILLLDALDENRHASEDFNKFQTELEAVIQPFRLVMITCRAQFFDSEKMIPEETSWMSTGRDKSLINYNKIYISPFTDEDIDKYLSIKYKGLREKKKRAHQIVEQCKNLMVRPLLLSYIDDLIEENVEYTELSEIYNTLINKWLQREVNRIQDRTERQKQKETLARFSIDIAKTIYSNWKNVKSMQLNSDQMKSFMSSYGYNEVPFDIKRRSLINRNASGAFKFSHKSFLEFFLAKELFNNPSFDFLFDGMDMAKVFFDGMCIHEYNKQKAAGVFSVSIPRNKLLESEVSFCIKDSEKINYAHTRIALHALNIHPKTISFPWRSFSKELLQFLDDIKVISVEVSGYKSISTISPKDLLSISSLTYISFKSKEALSLPKSYINNARKLSVTTIYNGETITAGTRFDRLPIRINIDYQSFKSLQEINDDIKKTQRLILKTLLEENEKN